MGLNISLFVHGVPMGQKIWGPKGDDQRYIQSFYGPNWNAPELMKIETLTLGGVTNCYYSFVKGQNVCDSQGRAGSYFALTLRVNAFYADVQNLYNILRAAYEKMCVGLCVQDNGTSVKYAISDFQNVDAQLKEIESHIINYIGEFSVNEDLAGLSGLVTTSQGAPVSVNLHECTKRVALDCMKKQGKIVVSPYYLSASAAKTVEKYKAEMEATKQKAQQEIQLQQKTSQERIDTIKKDLQAKIDAATQQADERVKQVEERSRQENDQIREDYESRLQKLRQEYSNVDEKIKELKSKASNWEKEFDKKDKELRSCNEKLRKLQEASDKQHDNTVNMGGDLPGAPHKRPIALKKKLVVCVASLFVLLLIGGGIFWLMGKKENKQDDVAQEQSREEAQDGKVANQNKTTPVERSSKDSVYISIKENGCEVSEVESGHLYNISLEGGSIDEQRGQFECPAFDQQGQEYFMAKRDSVGKTCIRYKVDGKTKVTKNVVIKH